MNKYEEMHEREINKSISLKVNKKILLLKARFEEFHLLYVKNYSPSLSSFNSFRAKYLNKIREVKINLKFIQELQDFFINEKMIQLVINLLQICFHFHEEMKENVEYFDDFFDYFFYSTCYLIIKVNN